MRLISRHQKNSLVYENGQNSNRSTKKTPFIPIRILAFFNTLNYLRKFTWHAIQLNTKEPLFHLRNCCKCLKVFFMSLSPVSFALYEPDSVYSFRWQKELDCWVNDSSIGKKEIAAERIKQALINQCTNLDLRNLGLNSLPQCITQITSLEKLDISFNQLSDLPKDIQKLTSLENLDLSKNSFEVFPKAICDITSLVQVRLYKNQLKTLPQEIQQLVNLEVLFTSFNQLSGLPNEIGQLRSLKLLYLSGNEELRELPESLNQIPGLDVINIEHTKVNREHVNAILEQCYKLRVETAAEQLPSRLNIWKTISQEEVDLSGINLLDGQRKIILNEFLMRLERSKDFTSKAKSALAKKVCAMLPDLSENKNFQETFFSYAESNNTNCEDRTAMALAEIYVAWRVSKLPAEANEKEIFEILVKGAKSIVLRDAISEFISLHEQEQGKPVSESVEIYLYYEVHWAEKLKTMEVVKDMLYSRVGKRSWIDEKEEEIAARVNEKYLNILLDFPVINEMFEKHKKQSEEFKCKRKQMYAELEKENGAETDYDHLVQSKQKIEEYKTYEKQFKNKWLRKKLGERLETVN